MNIPVASLCRVSTLGQANDDKAGLPRQREAVAEAVRRHGLHVVKGYELVDVDGALVAATPAWREIRAMLDAGVIRGVVLDNIDRICRASDLDLGVLADLQRAGGTLYTPGEVRSLASGSDRLITGIMALVAGHEKKRIIERSMEGKAILRKQGIPTERRFPPGITFDRATRTWGVVEPGITEMREAFARYGAGEVSVAALAAELAVPRRTMRERLANPLYRGWMVYDRKVITDRETGTRRYEKRAPEEIVRVRVFDEAPIPDHVTRGVDERLGSTGRAYKKRVTVPEDDMHLLRDVLICGGCGSKVGTVRRPRQLDGGYYCCSTAQESRRASHKARQKRTCEMGLMPVADVHHAVTTLTMQVLAVDETFKIALYKALRDGMGDDRVEKRAGVKARLDGLVERRERLLDAYLSGLASKDQLERRKGLLDRQIAALEAELIEHDAAGNEWADVVVVGLDRVRQFITARLAALKSTPLDPGASVEEQTAVVEGDLARNCSVIAGLLKGLGGKVVVWKPKAQGRKVPVRARGVRLTPRRLVDLASQGSAGTCRGRCPRRLA